MRCPRCRSEVGSQKLCPYCGSPMYLPDAKSAQNPDAAAWNRLLKLVRSMEARMADAERKLKVMIVLESGIFVLLLLILVAILVK